MEPPVSRRKGQRMIGERSVLSLWMVLALPLVAACGLSPREEALLDSWLQCGECTDGELDSLLAVAGRKRDATVERLKDDLMAGPGAQRLANIRSQYEASYDTLTNYRSRHPRVRMTLTRDQYTSHYLENYSALFRSRAALALARIGGSDFGPVLDSAVKGERRPEGPAFRQDVRDAARFARDSVPR